MDVIQEQGQGPPSKIPNTSCQIFVLLLPEILLPNLFKNSPIWSHWVVVVDDDGDEKSRNW